MTSSTWTLIGTSARLPQDAVVVLVDDYYNSTKKVGEVCLKYSVKSIIRRLPCLFLVGREGKNLVFCASKVGGIPFFCITPKSYPKTLQHWGAGIPFFCITPKFHPKSLQHSVSVSITRRFLAKIGGISARSCQKKLAARG